VLDRFHLVKNLNAVVDEVRKQQWRAAGADQKKAIKGLRWLLYRHFSTRSRKQTAALKALERSNRRIYRAWRLKDEFEQLWEYKARWAATHSLNGIETLPMKGLDDQGPLRDPEIAVFPGARVSKSRSVGNGRAVALPLGGKRSPRDYSTSVVKR